MRKKYGRKRITTDNTDNWFSIFCFYGLINMKRYGNGTRTRYAKKMTKMMKMARLNKSMKFAW